jgi:hypothetical protein
MLLQITTGTVEANSKYAEPFSVTWNFTQGPGRLTSVSVAAPNVAP